MVIGWGAEALGEEPPKALTSSLTKNTITFSDDDVKRIQTPYNDVVVFSMTTTNYDVKRNLVNN